jgi:hypothetical protein
MKYWFYVREVTPVDEVAMPQYTMEPSVPRFLKIKQIAMAKQMVERMDQLEEQGLKSINLYNCWLGRRLIPLATRAHPMWLYTRPGDITWSLGPEWDNKEYAAALKRITQAQFLNFEEGLPSFTPDGTPVPTVSSISSIFFLCL